MHENKIQTALNSLLTSDGIKSLESEIKKVEGKGNPELGLLCNYFENTTVEKIADEVNNYGKMPVFKSTRRHEGDIGCEWAKNNELNCQFSGIKSDCDFYALRHWLLKCGSTPYFETFMEKEWLAEYIVKHVRAGDALEIWAINGERMQYVWAKMPDENGLIPVKGCAY